MMGYSVKQQVTVHVYQSPVADVQNCDHEAPKKAMLCSACTIEEGKKTQRDTFKL